MNEDLYMEVQEDLVSSIMADGDLMTPVLEASITVDDFTNPQLRLIFWAQTECHRTGQKITPVAVATMLAQNAQEAGGTLEQAGGVAEIYRLYRAGADRIAAGDIQYYVRYVLQESSKQQARDAIAKVAAGLRPNSGVDVNKTLAHLKQVFDGITVRAADNTEVSTGKDLAHDFMGKLAERARVREENAMLDGLQGIPTLLPGLDKYTSGWQGGQMIVIAARTGVGKSVFAVNCAAAACAAGKSVMFFSLEMKRDEIENRLVSCMSGVPLNDLKQGKVKPEDTQKLKDTLDAFAGMRLVLDTSASVTIDSIRSKAVAQAQSPAGLDMIVIDYLQLIEATNVRQSASRENIVSGISRGVKMLAKELDVPVLVLAQLNRARDGEEEQIPTHEKMRESHGISQDADMIVILHREQATDNTVIPKTRVILDKNRHGASGKTILCHSNLECSLFREMKKKPKQPEAPDDDTVVEDGLDEYGDKEDWDF